MIDHTLAVVKSTYNIQALATVSVLHSLCPLISNHTILSFRAHFSLINALAKFIL